MAFSSMVKDINRKIILESFWDFSRNTKQDITKKTELSFPTVSKLVDELNEQDIIHMLSDKRGETGGRKANEYILNQEYAYSLCLKVEREYIEVFIVDLYKQNISYDKIEENRPLNVVRAMRSNTKQARYKNRYLPAVLKRRSDRISTKGIRLNTGFIKFIIPSLLVLNINVVTVSSKINFVRGSSRIPLRLSVVAEKDTPSIMQFPLSQSVFSGVLFQADRPKWQRQKSRQPQG